MSTPVWVVIGLVILGMVLLVLCAAPLLGRLRRAKAAADRLQNRAAEAQALQAKLEELQPRLAAMQERVRGVQGKLAAGRS